MVIVKRAELIIIAYILTVKELNLKQYYMSSKDIGYFIKIN